MLEKSNIECHIDIDQLEQRVSFNLKLQNAIAQKDLAEVQSLFSAEYIDKNYRDINGMSFLHYAVNAGDINIIQFILDQGALVDAKDEVGATPLYYATNLGNIEAIKLLLDYKANVTAPIYNSNVTPLHIAAKASNVEILKLFLAEENIVKNKINVDVQDINGYTPLHYAIECEKIESFNDTIKTIELLIKNKASLDAQTADGFTCFHLVATSGREELLTLLLKNINYDNPDPKAILPFNIKANLGISPLQIAAAKGHYQVFETLIDARANVNIINDNETTPLHYAALNGHFDVVQLLIENGANINMTNLKGETPYDFAAESNHYNITEFILDQRSSQNDYIEEEDEAAEEITDANDDALQDADIEGMLALTIMSIEDYQDSESLGSTAIPNTDL